VHSTDGPALGGLDIEMGTRPPYETNFLATPFLESLRAGKLPISSLDDKVRRHLYVMFKLKMLDPTPAERAGSLNTREHQQVSREIAEQGIVLLKNEQNLLPLDLGKIKTITVIGDNAVQKFTHAGFGATVKTFYEVTPLEAIINRVGNRANVTYSAGFAAPGARGGRGRGRGATQPADDTSMIDRAVEAARSADVVIFVGGLNHTAGYDDEGTDRRDLRLPFGQDELIGKIIAANPKTVVALNCGAAIEMDPWLDKTSAVLVNWYGGMEAGNALARVLFGDVNPSGRLPCTFPRKLADSPAHAMNAFPGSNGTIKYEEGLLVGYRWFDTKNIEPLFPFGFGLSYTKFEYSNLKLTPGTEPSSPMLKVEFDVANTGSRDGAEVAQVYVQDVDSTQPRPNKELKGFAKVMLKAGEKRTVSIPLNWRSLAYYDPEKSGWVAEAGDFVVQIGSSSREIRLKGDYKLAQTLLEK
jgi:beta-glucosidase